MIVTLLRKKILNTLIIRFINQKMSENSTQSKKSLKPIKKIAPKTNVKTPKVTTPTKKKSINIADLEIKAPIIMPFKIVRKTSPSKKQKSEKEDKPDEEPEDQQWVAKHKDAKFVVTPKDGEPTRTIIIQAILESPIQDDGEPFEYREQYINGRKITKYDQLLVSLIPRMREVIVEEMMKMDPDKVERILTRIRPEDLDEKAYELAKICLDQVLEDMLDERIEKRKEEGVMTQELIDDMELAEAMKVYNKYNKYFYEDEEGEDEEECESDTKKNN